MVDPDAGKAVSGRDVIEEVLNSGVESLSTEELNSRIQFAHQKADNGADGILTAINNASEGDEVWVVAGKGSRTDGSYLVEKSSLHAIDITTKNVTLRGVGRPLLYLANSATTDTANSFDDAIVGIGANNVTVEGLKINGNKANQPTADTEQIQGIVGYGGVDDGTVSDNEIHNCTGNGYTYDPDNGGTGRGWRFEGNEVYATDNNGIQTGSDDATGVDNYVHDIPTQDGIEPIGDNNTWRGNVVRNTAGTAFDPFGATGTTIEGNVVIVGDNGPNAISNLANGATAINVVGNVMLGSVYTGATFSSDTVVDSWQHDHKGCKVADNLALGLGVQQQLGHDEELRFEDNTLIDGFAQISIKQGTAGNESQVTVRGNTLVNSTNQGIAVWDNGGTVVEDNTIINPATEGIRIKRGDYAELRDNTIKGAGGIGIRDASGATGLKIVGNTAVNSTYQGVVLENQDGALVEGNTMRENDGGALAVRANDGNAHSDVEIRQNRSRLDSDGIAVSETSGSYDHVVLQDNLVKEPTNSAYDLTVTGVLFRNGVELLSASPTATDYTADDIGRRVIDQSTAPSTIYVIDGAGSVDQAS